MVFPFIHELIYYGEEIACQLKDQTVEMVVSDEGLFHPVRKRITYTAEKLRVINMKVEMPIRLIAEGSELPRYIKIIVRFHEINLSGWRSPILTIPRSGNLELDLEPITNFILSQARIAGFFYVPTSSSLIKN